MRKCSDCGGNMKELGTIGPDGLFYNYYKCLKCGEEVLDMRQLHEVAERYRALKRYHARLTKWGLSVGLRIPKELVKKYKFKANKEVTIIPEEKGIRIMLID
jgi:DNA-directed RNA polymerase subunit RPC12/RpoP